MLEKRQVRGTILGTLESCQKAAGSSPDLVTWQIARGEQLEALRSTRNLDNQANGGGGNPPHTPSQRG